MQAIVWARAITFCSNIDGALPFWSRLAIRVDWRKKKDPQALLRCCKNAYVITLYVIIFLFYKRAAKCLQILWMRACPSWEMLEVERVGNESKFNFEIQEKSHKSVSICNIIHYLSSHIEFVDSTIKLERKSALCSSNCQEFKSVV